MYRLRNTGPFENETQMEFATFSVDQEKVNLALTVQFKNENKTKATRKTKTK